MVSNSQLGEWGQVEIEQLCEKLVVGYVGSCEEHYTDGSSGVMMIRTGDIKGFSLDYSKVKYISNAFHEMLKKSQLICGDILIARHGNSGHGVVFDLKEPANALNIVIMRTNENVLHNRFLVYLLDSSPIQRQVQEASAGSTQNVINTSQIAKLMIPVPSIEEQRQISRVLEEVDRLICFIEKIILKKKAIKQGAMQELLTGKKRLPGFSGEWKTFNLMKHSKIKARIGWQGLKKSEYLENGFALLVTGTDFADGKVQWGKCHYVTRSRYEQDSNIQIQNNDLLITKDGSLGKTVLVQGLTKRATLNSGIFVVRPLQQSYDPAFAYYILSSCVFKDFLDKLSAGSTIIHLYQKDIGKFEFLLPPTLGEQKAIASVLADMDADIASLEEKLIKYRQVKQGMMQQLLTGRIRLK